MTSSESGCEKLIKKLGETSAKSRENNKFTNRTDMAYMMKKNWGLFNPVTFQSLL